jgi:hypothetical protein
VTAVRFSPEVEFLVATNLTIELGQGAKETLQNVPGSNSSKIGSVNLSGVDDRISASSIGLGCVHERTSDGVKGTLFFLLVTETNSKWLGKEQHVGDLAPTVGVDLSCEIGGDVARTEFWLCQRGLRNERECSGVKHHITVNYKRIWHRNAQVIHTKCYPARMALARYCICP